MTTKPMPFDEELPSRETPSILVIEDEPVLRSTIVRGLMKLKPAEVIGASSLSEAVQLIEASRPKLIVSDLRLPDGIGVEILYYLDEYKMNIPVFFVSAHLQNYAPMIPMRANIELFEKPFSLDMLRRRAEKYLQLEEEDEPLPFALTDYIQLSCVGNHSIEFVLKEGEHTVGRIAIFQGQLWSAEDLQGTGEPALRRLLFSQTAHAQCRRLQDDPGSRNLEGHWEGLLLEAARIFDEGEEYPIDIPTWGNSLELQGLHESSPSLEAVTDSPNAFVCDTPPSFSLYSQEPQVALLLEERQSNDDFPVWEDQTTTLEKSQPAVSRLTSQVHQREHDANTTSLREMSFSLLEAQKRWDSVLQNPPTTQPMPSIPSLLSSPQYQSQPEPLYKTEATTPSRERFEQFYDEGIALLLRKNYVLAYEKFSQAAQLFPEESCVIANLNRLREMGYGQSSPPDLFSK